MAAFFPDELPHSGRNDPRLRAEVKLYDALRDRVDRDWVVYYHVAWLGLAHPAAGPRDGETDFIIASPDRGLLLIEVEGGGIRYDGATAQWWSTDHRGVDHAIDPFEQLRQSKYALLEKLKSLPGWSGRWVRMAHAVAFPDVVVGRVALPPDAPAEIIIDAEDLGRIDDRILEIFDYWQGREPGQQQHGRALMADLERMLAPRVRLRNPLASEVAEEEREFLRLTESQFNLLDFLGRRRRAAVCGCAGSGKTMLAVEKARRLAGEGFRTALVCYHEPLAEHLAHAVERVSGLEAYSFRQLSERVAEAAGLSIASLAGLSDREQYDALADALVRAVQGRLELRFDAIVVDEGQDFHELGWVALQECLREGRDSVLYVFYDDNQRVYADRPLPPIPEEDRFTLAENVRNTRTIHRALTAYYRGAGPSRARGPIGRAVETIGYGTPRELASRLGALLHRLVVAERVPVSQVAVLTPRSLGQSELLGLRFDNGFRLVGRPSGGSKEVLCAGVAEFKGLERAVVIVSELDEVLLQHRQLEDLCYVGFSRARSHLILMGRDGVLTHLVAVANETGR